LALHRPPWEIATARCNLGCFICGCVENFEQLCALSVMFVTVLA